MQLVVADAGPLIALAVAGVLPLALEQFEFCVPQAVLDECLADAYSPGVQSIFEASRQLAFTLIPYSAIQEPDSAYAMGFGSGEVAVVCYAHEHRQIAMIDERRARRIAQRLGVSVVGSGAVLLMLKKSGAVASLQTALKAWRSHGYFLSPALHDHLLASAGERAS